MGKKKFSINIVSQIVSFVVSLGVSFVLTPFITKHLGKEVYGFVGMAYQVTSYITLFTIAFTSMHNVFVATEYHRGEIQKANEIYSSVTITNIFLAIILFIPLMLIAIFVDRIFEVPIDSVNDIKILWICIFILFLINLANGTYSVATYIKNRLDLNAVRELISNMVKGMLLLFLYLLFQPKVWYVGIVALICGIYVISANYLYMKKLVPELSVLRENFRIGAIKELLSVGIWNTVTSLTYILNNGLDLLISNVFISALAMGYLSYAQTIPTQVYNLINLIFGTFNPEINRLYAQGDREGLLREINKAMRIGGIICSVPIVGFLIFLPDFFKIWLPTLEAYEINTIQILSILILSNTIMNIYINPVYFIPTMMKKIKIPVIVSLVFSVLNIITELILLKTTNLGIYAIEIATAFFLTFESSVIKPFYTAHILKVSPSFFYKIFFKGLVTMSVVGVLFFFVRNLFEINSWIKLFAIAGVVGIIGYVISVLFMLNKEEKKNLVQFGISSLKKFDISSITN